jgi:biotin/methionine sulfoxide reductase
MKQAIAPVGASRNDYDIFAGLADRLGAGEAFTEGRGEMDWLRHLYRELKAVEPDAPDFETFWDKGYLEFTDAVAGASHRVLLSDFRADPVTHPLPTPSGRLEIHSDTIAAFGYADCPPHPAWLEPSEWLGAAAAARYPLHLLSNQPATRLHSQWDHGPVSRDAKIRGREAVRLNPRDAAARDIADGDLVRLFNDRGACLAGARISDSVAPGVAVLPTGAWYDPATPGHPGGLERHGNPNVLTRDAGTSRLAQGPCAQTCLVEVEKFSETPPTLSCTEAPPIR